MPGVLPVEKTLSFLLATLKRITIQQKIFEQIFSPINLATHSNAQHPISNEALKNVRSEAHLS